MNIIFASDIHGSSIVWNKYLNIIKEKEEYLFILAGDLCGKYLAKIKHIGNNIKVQYDDRIETLNNVNQLKREKYRIEMKGGYWYNDDDEKDGKTKKKIFLENKVARLTSWIDEVKALKMLNNTVIFTTGNDDPSELSDLSFNNINNIYFDKKVIYLCDYLIYSFPFVTPTPWNTPGEMDESQIEKILESDLYGIDKGKKLIFNFHCPPYNTAIDIGPIVNSDYSLMLGPGGTATTHLGSRSIRNAIEKYKPILSLHGHIHEAMGHARIKNTICLNPGSEYDNGILKYYEIYIRDEMITYKHCEI